MSNDHAHMDDGTPSARPTTSLSKDDMAAIIRKTVIDDSGPMSRGRDGRFRKGQSGNPKGRPPREAEPDIRIHHQTTKARLLEELRRPIQVRENGRTVEMSVDQALIRAEIAGALKGNAYAQRHLHDRIERLEREEAIEIARQNAVFLEYQARCRAEIETAKQRGEPLPNPVPHPDDIVIEDGKRVRFIGPVDETEVAKCERDCRVRDTLLMQDSLDERSYDQSSAHAPEDQPGSAMLLAVALDKTLPPRLRLSEAAMTVAYSRHDATPKRVLLKKLYRAWRSLGYRVERGRTFPPLAIVEARLRTIFGIVATIQRRGVDPAELTPADITEFLEEVMDR
ncbi:MAG TPA: DUF5681 domain-containing protein [Kaistiaceae bacterium]|nr:DUF5681 domain-containing protein [Kaistiaceae bacterium]